LKAAKEEFKLLGITVPSPHLMMKVINYVDMMLILQLLLGMAYMGAVLAI